MHCVTAILIGFCAWLVAFSYIVFNDGSYVVGLIAAPVTISGVTALVLTADYTMAWLLSALTKYLSGDARGLPVANDAYELESTTGKGNQKR